MWYYTCFELGYCLYLQHTLSEHRLTIIFDCRTFRKCNQLDLSRCATIIITLISITIAGNHVLIIMYSQACVWQGSSVNLSFFHIWWLAFIQVLSHIFDLSISLKRPQLWPQEIMNILLELGYANANKVRSLDRNFPSKLRLTTEKLLFAYPYTGRNSNTCNFLLTKCVTIIPGTVITILTILLGCQLNQIHLSCLNKLLNVSHIGFRTTQSQHPSL
jgi:hypothetical protein